MNRHTDTEQLQWNLFGQRGAIFGDSINRQCIEDKIYHYTSPQGFEGILFNDKKIPALLFSRFDCLNDKSEGVEILTIYREMLDCEKQNPNISNDYLEAISDIELPNVSFFTVDYKNHDTNHNLPNYFVTSAISNSYICSFSKSCDDLAMWNYYVKGARYEGYNIGFSSVLLSQYFAGKQLHEGYHFELIEVIYDKRIKQNIVKRLIEVAYDQYNKSPKRQAEIDIVRRFISDSLGELRFYFKSDYFKHEQEVRAIITLPDKEFEDAKQQFKPPIEYRYSNGITIPFITVYFNDMPYMIDTITIGPVDLDTEQRNIQCEILRERLSSDYENAEVHYSNAPVRY